MTNTFPHGYALLIGVGESAYPKCSLPVTAKDIGSVGSSLYGSNTPDSSQTTAGDY